MANVERTLETTQHAAVSHRTLNKEAREIDEPILDPRLGTPQLSFNHVSKWYGPVIGVNQVTLHLHRGITGLVGANGAGKSTLLRLATGQLRPDIGEVSVGELNAWSWKAKRLVGYCSDVDAFYEEMSGIRFVETIARMCGYVRSEWQNRASAAVDRVGMAGRSNRPMRGYSKGMRQRIKLAAALIHDPPVVVLDEPMAGIDPVGRREFLELFLALADQGKCLIVSSHELESLEKLTDHVAVMARGRLVAHGTLAKIRDLFEDLPLSVRIDCDRSRDFAAKLIAWDDVAGVDAAANTVIVRAKNPRRFFRMLTRLILKEDVEVSHLEPLDDSAHAILGYLLGGSGRT
jgi:ABC-2 type transport system ATP-binding protein